MTKYLLSLAFLLLPLVTLNAQQRKTRQNINGQSSVFGVQNDDNDNRLTMSDEDRRNMAGRKKDSKKKKKNDIPTGLKTWRVDDQFGVIDSIAPDTLMHGFQNTNFTDGQYGEYNTLGNMGSPRMARIFALRPREFSYFFFSDPYDFFITPFSNIVFTNTKSPITNITYHECGNRDNGEDRIRALYAVNANKDIGFGLKFDYLYGRGYYDHQSTSDFNFTLWGSVDKEAYKAHFTIFTNYLKTAENGGITDDDYVENPENFPSKFGTSDIPTNLEKVWNKMHFNGLHLTHSYSLGFHRMETHVDTSKNATKADAPPILLPGDQAKTGKQGSREPSIQNDPYSAANMSLTKPDTTQQKGPKIDTTYTFVPVTSFIHTLKVNYNTRDFIANQDLSGFYSNKYFEADSTHDKFTNTYVSNQFSVELHEGFNKWALAGIRLYARHEFNSFSMPVSRLINDRWTENRVTLGGSIFKEKGNMLHYNLLGEVFGDGKTWGEFKLSADARLRFKLGKDSVGMRAFAYAINREPTFLYRRFQSTYLQWNNDLSKQMTTHVGGTLRSDLTKTRLTLDVQNIKNYTYFGTEVALQTTDDGSFYTQNTSVRQASDNIQVLGLILNQDFRLGILNWENQVAYQTTSDKDILPLPAVSLYTNLYLKFTIAHVLHTEFGADMRYFSKYYAPTYSPAIGMFANQAEETRVKVGNHPVINVYANFHLKHTRFYIMAHHVNYSKNGSNVFLAPHYPYNPFALKLGISWDFFN